MMTVENADKSNLSEAMGDNLPIIIDFWAPWCGPCKMMGPIFEELSKEYEGKLKFMKLNTDEWPHVASQFNIQGIPCLIVIKDGKEVDRIVGFGPKEAIKQKIDNILSKM